MAERIVCDASPLIFLAKIDSITLLDAYEIYIPAQVEAEILESTKHKKQDATKITNYLQAQNIKSEKIALMRDLPRSLGQGERSVISLALRENIKRVLIDEAKARTIARFKGLVPRGTLRVLWDAYKEGIIGREDIESLTLDLIQKGYRIKGELIIEFLKKLRTNSVREDK